MGRKLFLFPHFYLINLHEEEGYKDDPNGDGNDHTEEDSGTDGMTAGRSGTRGKYHGQHTEYEGQRGHQDRAEPGSVMAACTASTPLSTSTLANSTIKMAF